MRIVSAKALCIRGDMINKQQTDRQTDRQSVIEIMLLKIKL